MPTESTIQPLTPLIPLTDDAPADDPVTGAIVGAALHVYDVLGPGFLEAVYQSAFARVLAERGIPTQREHPLPVWFEGAPLDVTYRVDFLCFDVLVELKALQRIGPPEFGQVINYLKASGGGKALLINFGSRKFDVRRFIV